MTDLFIPPKRHPNNSSWRAIAAHVVRQVLVDNPTVTGAPLMDLLRQAYPFGPKTNFPYKVWRDEVRKQLGVKSRKIKKPVQKEGQVGQGELW